MRKLLAAAEGHRLYALYVVAATLGLRRGELLGLRWSDLDLDNGTAAIGQTVQRAGGKLHLQDTMTEDSDNVLPLPDWTWLVLLDHRSASGGNASGWPRSGRITAWSSPPRSAPRSSPGTSTVISR
ncbi:hypothetical protein ABZ570_32600, partial [Micromonospora sp. NPDC007271]